MGLKSKIKKQLEKYPKFNKDTIISLIDKYEYISFDIFDTLIKRDVESPSDVFEIVGIEKNDSNFASNRLEAEKEARSNSSTEEITIDEIYYALKKNNNYSQRQIDEYKQLEITIEEKICTKSIELYDIYEYCLKKKKKIIIVSNMYLSKTTIEKILNSNGIKEYEKLYVSSEYRPAFSI